MAITREAWKQAQSNPIQMDAILRYSMMEAGQLRANAFLHEAGLQGKCYIGVVAIWNSDRLNELDAIAKVMLNDGSGSSFTHQEPYIAFPSDHFKAKVLLVTGGA